MLLLKANTELKEIFTRLIKTMDVPVAWDEVFVILNNNLILAGEVRSLIFNYEDKRAYTNVLELPLDNKEIEQLPKHALLTNLLNMTLYAFGKWDAIKGVTVEKDYAAINKLFQNILKEIHIEPSFRDDNFRFYKDGLQVTYEEVINAALKLVGEAAPKTEGNEDEEEGEKEEEYGLGLWHNMCWKAGTYAFEKHGKNESDAVKSRIGNNFYMVDYTCPTCKENMHMTVYPDDKEVLIETEEARVFLARVYTCSTCNCFYTPKPGKLLGERELYFLAFEDDRVAYEDYLEHIGRHGARISSNRMNEYEAVRKGKGKMEDADSASLEVAETDSGEGMGEQGEEISTAEGTSSNKQEEKFSREHGEGKGRSESHNGKGENYRKSRPAESRTPKQSKHDFSAKTIDDLKAIIKRVEGDDTNVPTETHRKEKAIHTPEYLEAAKSQLRERLKSKYDARMKTTGRMTAKQLADLKKQIQGEDELRETDVHYYVNTIDETLYENEKNAICQKTEAGKSKTYAEITRIMEEVERGEGLQEVRKEAVRNLKQLKAERGKQEVEHLVKHMPLHMDRKQYKTYIEKIKQYKDIDLTPYRSQLEERRGIAEKEEIAALVKRTGKKDRKALDDLYERLKAQDFSTENVKPYLEKIHDKIYELDKVAIAKICPDIMRSSFEEGMAAYEKIKESMFLPELKTNTLEMIRRRLTKIKMDENLQLVRKLKKEMENKIQDFSRLYFYEARQFQGLEPEGEQEKSETAVINCALNSYTTARGEFEFPLLVCDSSRKGSGKKGFVLTPDHIFYRDLLDSGMISIMDIERLEFEKGRIKKGIYVKNASGGKDKLPNGVSPSEKEGFVDILNEFIAYLQDKPESRSIDYLAKEEHVVKCCYRCGYTYEGGNVCPKCGNKVNN